MDGAGLGSARGWVPAEMISYWIESTDMLDRYGYFIDIAEKAVHSGTGTVFTLFYLESCIDHSLVIS